MTKFGMTTRYKDGLGSNVAWGGKGRREETGLWSTNPSPGSGTRTPWPCPHATLCVVAGKDGVSVVHGEPLPENS